MKLLIVDNNDSFTWNLVQLAREAGTIDIQAVMADEILSVDVELFDRIIFSPGPGLPSEFPTMFSILKNHPHKRILGVCLGHQAIGEYFGAKMENLGEVRHGRQVQVHAVAGHSIFSDITTPFEAGLYHSWILSAAGFPDCLEVTAVTGDGIIMAIRHRQYDIQGVQFHPESVMTPYGSLIMRNWLHNGK